ncbi:MAG: DUF4386 domain-containing protein [Acidobacteriia bacterium]|nr:DUF4386 domain-containing protein [Terriglobia bacterium]
MNSTKKAARVAGLLYVLMSIPGAFSLLYVPSVLIVPGDATATVNKIQASELLFRIGMVSELICATGFIFVALALYRLFKGVDKTQASLMVTLFVVSVPISFLNVLNQLAVLTLLSGANFLSAFDPRQLNALVMLFLGLHNDGILLAQIFWGLWLFPFGVLVFKSGFLPRILGVLLILACFGYLAISSTFLLLPAYGHIVSRFAMVLTLGELPIILWLLIKGAKDQPLDVPA